MAKKPDERFDSAEDFTWALTLLQDRFPLTGRELDEVVRNTLPALTQPVPLPAQGSTQDKLDREFLMTQTPAPASTLRLAEPPPPPPTAPPAPAEDLDATRVLASAAVTRREESLLDATWLSVPRPAKVEAEEPAPVVESGSGKTLRTVLIAATVVLLVVASWLGWRVYAQRQAPAGLEAQAPAQIPAPGTVPAKVTTGPTPVPALEEVEETPTPTPGFVDATPAPTPVPKKTPPRTVAPEDQVTAGEAAVPMQRGDLIRKGLPNVQEAEVDKLADAVYPAAAQGSGRHASVTVRVLVDENGHVVDAKIRDSGGSDFDTAALDAARRTTFLPATRDEIPGKMWTELSFEF
jgi:protein TonB